MDLNIVNVSMTASLNMECDLNRVASTLTNIIYNPRSFSACIYKNRNFRSTILLFKNGRIVCVGEKSEFNAKVDIRRFARILQKRFNYTPKITHYKTRSMTCIYKFGGDFDLNKIAQVNNWSYEVEIFPMIQMYTPSGIHVAISHKGSLIMTGVTNLKIASSELEELLIRILIS